MYEDVLNDIQNSTGSSILEELFELVVARLGILGYTVDQTKPAEVLRVNYSIKKAEYDIKNFCNIVTIPMDLMLVWTEMSAGHFLQEKSLTGDLASTMNIDDALTSIGMGDISLSFGDVDSADAKIKALVDSLLNHKEDLVCYRKVNW